MAEKSQHEQVMLKSSSYFPERTVVHAVIIERHERNGHDTRRLACHSLRESHRTSTV